MRTIPDTRNIMSWINDFKARNAVVIGGGYIGMEITENLHRRNIKVAVVRTAAAN